MKKCIDDCVTYLWKIVPNPSGINGHATIYNVILISQFIQPSLTKDTYWNVGQCVMPKCHMLHKMCFVWVKFYANRIIETRFVKICQCTNMLSVV